MKEKPAEPPRRFFYWIWSPFHVLVFVLLNILFIAPAMIVIALAANGIEAALNVSWSVPPGLDIIGILPAFLIAIPMALLMTQATFYVGSLIHIEFESEASHRLAPILAGILVVLLLAHKLPHDFDDFPLRAVPLVASFFAAVAIVLLNLVAWILHKLTGREIIFRYLTEQRQVQEKPKRAKKNRR